MPELPEVESVRRQLEPELSGRRVLAVWADAQRRFHAPDRLLGRRVEAVGRRGKFLLCPLDRGPELVLHLGMTGVLHFGTADDYAPARITLDHGREPLSDEFDPPRFARDLGTTRAPVKPYLLTQRPVAGVGNIYADEALWVARIHPASRRVGRTRAHILHAAIRDVLADAIEREGTTFRDYQMVNGESGRNATFLIAYGQAGRPCPRCATPLRKVALGGRGTTFCPTCQRRW